MKARKATRITTLILAAFFLWAVSALAVCAPNGLAQPPTGHPGGNHPAASLYALSALPTGTQGHYAVDLDGARGDRAGSEGMSERKLPALMAMLALLWLSLLIFLLHTWNVVSTTPLSGKKKPLLSLSIGGNSPPALHA